MVARTDQPPADDFARRAIERRAIEAVNWALPAVSYDLMLQAAIRDAKAAPNQIVFWSRLPDWKNQTLTPNPETIHVIPFVNTKEAGPMVLEIPPAGDGSITGTIMDCWQAAIEEIGAGGLDRGAGGKYVILPPGDESAAPPGSFAAPSMTYQSYALLRSMLKGGDDAVAKAVAYAKRIRLYPLAQAAHPPPTMFVDAVDVVYDATIPYDLRFFRSLDRIVQTEPWLERDRVMIDMLKSLGIEKGKAFRPDPRMEAILKKAARDALAWLDARYESGFPPYFEGRQWAFPAIPELAETAPTFYESGDAYSVDGRALADSYAFAAIKPGGAGPFYLIATKDRSARPLDGGMTYRLTVPANPPVRQSWSAAIYDRVTHALIPDVPRASRASRTPDLKKNADGSVDLYFAPEAPQGQEANWIPTRAGRRFEVVFRLYGPEKPLFDKSWQLPDLERLV